MWENVAKHLPCSRCHLLPELVHIPPLLLQHQPHGVGLLVSQSAHRLILKGFYTKKLKSFYGKCVVEKRQKEDN